MSTFNIRIVNKKGNALFEEANLKGTMTVQDLKDKFCAINKMDHNSVRLVAQGTSAKGGVVLADRTEPLSTYINSDFETDNKGFVTVLFKDLGM
jgi:hypothetical protein